MSEDLDQSKNEGEDFVAPETGNKNNAFEKVEEAVEKVEQGPQSIDVHPTKSMMVIFLDKEKGGMRIDFSTVLPEDQDYFEKIDNLISRQGKEEWSNSLGMISFAAQAFGRYEKIVLLEKGQEIPQEVIEHNSKIQS